MAEGKNLILSAFIGICTLILLLSSIRQAGAEAVENWHPGEISPGRYYLISIYNKKNLTLCRKCGSTIGDLDSVTANGEVDEDHHDYDSMWTIAKVGDKYSIQADDGRYLTRCESNCWRPEVQSRHAHGLFVKEYTASPLVAGTLWTAERMESGIWAFKSDNERYMNACPDCITGSGMKNFVFAHERYPSRQTAKWDLIPVVEDVIVPGAYYIMSYDEKGYLDLCEKCDGSRGNVDVATVDGSWGDPKSRWTFARIGGKYTIQASNGRYLAECPDCWNNAKGKHGASVYESSAGASLPHTLWRVTKIPNGRWTFIGNNGKYMRHCIKCTSDSEPDIALVDSDGPSNDDYSQWNIIPVAEGNARAAIAPGAYYLKSSSSYTKKCLNLCAGCKRLGGNLGLVAVNGLHGNATAVWRLNLVEGKYTIQAWDGTYLARCRERCYKSNINQDAVFVYESSAGASFPHTLWKAKQIGNGRWAFRADNRKYLNVCHRFCVPNMPSILNFGFVHGTDPNSQSSQWELILA